MKQGFLTSDWFAGLAICTLVIVLGNLGSFDRLERGAYDLGVSYSSRTPNDKIAVIAIDDSSIANIGRWPWPRDIHAAMHNILGKSGAKIIGQTTFFIDPQIDPGLKHIQQLINFYADSSLSTDMTVIQRHLPPQLKSLELDLGTLGQKLLEAELQLNTDRILSQSLEETRNIILAMHFSIGTPHGKPDTQLPAYVSRNRLTNINSNLDMNPEGINPLPTVNSLFPIEQIGKVADSMGSLTAYPDSDGGIRSEPLVINYYNELYPSLSLMIAARSMNLNVADIEVNLGQGIELGGLQIHTDPFLQMNTFFYNSKKIGGAFPVDSFYDVLQGKIPASKYKDKIVLIGATATGVGDTMVTPIDSAMAPVLTLAHSVSSILNEDFFIEPEWSQQAIQGITAFIAIYIILLLSNMKAGLSASLTIVLLAGLLGTHFILMTKYGMWLQLMNPAVLLIAGHLLLTTKRYLLTEKGKLQADAESTESNRMLGLSLQGQGQLDAAFEKFRKLPANKESMELLYNLALDFERKRQFNKAASIYAVIKQNNPKFRDIKQRMTRAQMMEETVILGGNANSPGGTLNLNKDGVEKPMLGRYQVEKELGKGAMGAVYLGKDPKISRVVAIKTMALSQEFEGDELQDVKDRFFREAETAGRLSHPNIVTIYDAGEEHDLAYIAMEFLKGHDMVRYGKPDALLPVSKVLSLMSKAADALDYANSQNVVHRDIKPANLMYEPESDTLKITDFGIARITDSSKTKTGMVLGTPSYMSPEQLSGKKVDGRSDLFSLGVMLFQLVTGRLPFQGDSMATLMYKIANENHPAADSIRPELPRCVSIVINRALAKDREKRYQTGAQMASDLRKCLQIVNKMKKA
ncbi:MAG: CHASE2 domain-containing protein [Gammaproteobacteria bacterium]|nr:CHASE2 domain-containing protein [Gammaproteobacteria bacterium]